MSDLTEANAQKILEPLADAGGARELKRWIKEVSHKGISAKRKRGRPLVDNWEEIDFLLLREIELRHVVDYRLRTVSAIMKEVIQEALRATKDDERSGMAPFLGNWPAGKPIGASLDAVYRRLFSRIRPSVFRSVKGRETAVGRLARPQFDSPLAAALQPRAGKPRVDPNYVATGWLPTHGRTRTEQK
jgi:hypothetical protein